MLNAPDGLGGRPLEPLGSRCEPDGIRGNPSLPTVRSALKLPDHPLSDKTTLRRHLRRQRSALSLHERARAEWLAAQQARGWLRPGKRIAAYIPVGSEFSPWPLIMLALQRGAQVYLPQVPLRGRRMRFVRLDADTRWGSGPHGIPEPENGKECPPRLLDTVFLPLVGFDDSGARLGQGGGYYDTTFAFRRPRRHWKKPRLIGLGFACQRVVGLTIDPWDVRLDGVLTGE